MKQEKQKHGIVTEKQETVCTRSRRCPKKELDNCRLPTFFPRS